MGTLFILVVLHISGPKQPLSRAGWTCHLASVRHGYWPGLSWPGHGDTVDEDGYFAKPPAPRMHIELSENRFSGKLWKQWTGDAAVNRLPGH